MTGPGPQRRVLVAVREGRLDPRLLGSALDLCRRLDASMDILLIAGEATPPVEMDDFCAALRAEGQAFDLQMIPTLRRRDIVAYANAHESIAAVVIDSLEGWEDLALDRPGDPWKRLECPLVTAAPRAKPIKIE